MGPANATNRRRERPFFGWYVVDATFVSFFIAFGYIYAFGVFAGPLSASFRMDRETVSLLFSLSYSLYLLVGAATGRIADRTGPRPVVTAGGVLIGVGLILSALAGHALILFVAFTLGIGLGLGCVYVPATEVVEHWFVRRRGYASGITVAGVGAGNLILPPLAEILVSSIGWRPTFVILGAVAAIAIPAASSFLVRSPEVLGLYPDGKVIPGEDVALLESEGLTVREALHSRPFWLLYAAVLSGSLALFLPFAHLQLYAIRYGASPEVAAVIVGLIGGGTLVSRLVLGGYTDRFQPRPMLAVTFLGTSASMVVWLIAHHPLPLGLFAFLFGLCYGTNSALLPAITVDYFGEKHSGAIMGLLFTAAVPGSLLGPTLAGEAYDAFGSYTIAIAAAIVVFLAATAFVLASTDPTPPELARPEAVPQ